MTGPKPPAAAPPPSRGTPLPALLILIAGSAAALGFRSDGADTPAAPAAVADTLVRRIQGPQPEASASTTHLLGYVESDVAFGTAATPERRTAAQIDRTAAWSEVEVAPRATSAAPASPSPPPSLPPQFIGLQVREETALPTTQPVARLAAASNGPLAAMRPYAEPRQSLDSAAASLSSTPANATQRHVVRDGDTLADLAERYYGDRRRYREIFDVNRATLTDPELLPIGATLEIPAFDPRNVPAPQDPPSARLLPQIQLQSP